MTSVRYFADMTDQSKELATLLQQLAEAQQELQTTVDALGHKECELQNVVERNRELELCIARHADEMYAIRRELSEAQDRLDEERYWKAEFNSMQQDMKELSTETERLKHGLANCRLLAARHRKEDWALLVLGFCAEAGVVGSTTR